MKTNMSSRLLATVLALLMVFSVISVGFAESSMELMSDDYEVLSDDAVKKYYQLLLNCETHDEYVALCEALTPEQFDYFVSKLTEEQWSTVEQMIPNLYVELYEYKMAVNVTNAGPLMPAVKIESPVATFKLAPRAASTEPFANGYVEQNGMYLDKDVVALGNDQYKITMSAFMAAELKATPCVVLPTYLIKLVDVRITLMQLKTRSKQS